MSKTLIKGGCVLTLGARTQNFPVADVLIENGAISEIRTGVRARGAEVVDATDAIVMPGFVDAHRHSWRSLFRNAGESVSGDVAAHLTAEDLYAATLVSLLSAVEAGITTVADWSDLQFPDAHVEAALQAHQDSGLRTVLISGAPGPGKGGPLNTIAFGASTPGTIDEAVSELGRARELGRRVHVHLGGRPSHTGMVSSLGVQGLLGPDVTIVHGTNLSDSDFDAISKSGGRLVLTPSTEMAGGLGMPPLQAIIDRSIRPGLGVGDTGVGPGDIFSQMRLANSVQHAALFDRKLAGKGGIPNLLSTRDVIKFATGGGAHAVGLGDVTGSLEPGKQADVIVLRADRPNIAPVNDPIGAVVWGMDTSNVDWVFVGGRPVVRKGVVSGADRSRRLAEQSARRVAETAGSSVAGSRQAKT